MIGHNHYHGPSERTREHTTLIRHALNRTVRYCQMSKDAHDLLAELEVAIATVEEIRYRLAHELGAPGAAAAPPTPADQPPPTQSNPYHDLAPTGRGAWAWAKEHDRVNQLAAIGARKRYPPRIVDWSPAQVLAAAQELQRRERPTTAREPGEDDDADEQPEYVPPLNRRRTRRHNGAPSGKLNGTSHNHEDIPY